MKKLLSILICLTLLLAGCAAQSDSPGAPDATAGSATPNTATPDEATPDEAPTAAPTEAPTEPPAPEECARERLDAILAGGGHARSGRVEVPEIFQYPELPTGCEAAAATIAIRSFGYELTAVEFAREWLVYGDDLIHAFVGDPFGYGGAGIFPPGLCRSVQRYIDGTDAHLAAFDLTGTEPDDLYRLIDSGVPVVVWSTYYLSDPQLVNPYTYDGHTVYWYENEHCLCLYGYDEAKGVVYLSDPIQGKVTGSAETFEAIYNETGRMAMVILDTTEWIQDK